MCCQGWHVLKVLLQIGLIFWSFAASAATIEVISGTDPDQKIILVSGAIETGDANRFYDTVANIERGSVFLQSPGGLVDEALSIGAEIHLRKFSTYVLPETACYSACALIWLSGHKRYTSKASTIGVHAAFYKGSDGTRNVSGAGNAELGAYLATIGLRREAIRFITTAEPGEGFLYLTPAIARKLGIEIFEQTGTDTIKPTEAPTAPRIIHDVAAMLAFDLQCDELFGANGQSKQTAKTQLQRANDTFGHDVTNLYLGDAAEDTRNAIDIDGALLWCLVTSQELLGADYDIGISGPSFSCAKATSVNEQMICQSPSLWGLDRALSHFYKSRRANVGAKVKDLLRVEQRSWLAARQRCSGDRGCTSTLYYQRIGALLRH